MFFQRYKVTFRYYVGSHQMADVLEKTQCLQCHLNTRGLGELSPLSRS